MGKKKKKKDYLVSQILAAVMHTIQTKNSPQDSGLSKCI